MTRQEMFNKAAQGILAQGVPSYDPVRQMCMYRGPNDTKCGIGHLIPDELYNPKMEENSVVDLDSFERMNGEGQATQKLICKAAHIRPSQFDFADDLQRCHDDASIKSRIKSRIKGDIFIFEFRRRMRDLAKRYKLNAAVLETGQ